MSPEADNTQMLSGNTMKEQVEVCTGNTEFLRNKSFCVMMSLEIQKKLPFSDA